MARGQGVRVAGEGALRSDPASPCRWGPRPGPGGALGTWCVELRSASPDTEAGVSTPHCLVGVRGSVLRLQGRDRAAHPGVPCPCPAASPPWLLSSGAPWRPGPSELARQGPTRPPQPTVSRTDSEARAMPAACHRGCPCWSGAFCVTFGGCGLQGTKPFTLCPLGTLNIRRRHGCPLPGVQQPQREVPVGWGQTAVGAAAVTSGCDRGSQAGPQGAGEEGAPPSHARRPRAACCPGLCLQPRRLRCPVSALSAPGTSRSCEFSAGLGSPGGRLPHAWAEGATSEHLRPSGNERVPPSSGVWDLPGSGLS